MTEIINIPADQPIKTAIADLSLTLTFGPVGDRTDLTGYTFTPVVNGADGTTTAWTVANTDLTGGIITISLTDVQIAAIGKGYHSWKLGANTGVSSGDVVYMSGTFQVV